MAYYAIADSDYQRKAVEKGQFDYRFVARMQYQAAVWQFGFFDTHAEYEEIDAETV